MLGLEIVAGFGIVKYVVDPILDKVPNKTWNKIGSLMALGKYKEVFTKNKIPMGAMDDIAQQIWAEFGSDRDVAHAECLAFAYRVHQKTGSDFDELKVVMENALYKAELKAIPF